MRLPTFSLAAALVVLLVGRAAPLAAQGPAAHPGTHLDTASITPAEVDAGRALFRGASPLRPTSAKAGRALLRRLARPCWEGERDVIRRADVDSALQTDASLAPDVRQDLLSLLRGGG